jgi:hypothetical protein
MDYVYLKNPPDPNPNSTTPSPPQYPLEEQLLLLSPPKPDFTSKRSGAKKCPAPSGALLSKRGEVASSCWRATEKPLYQKIETTPE